MTLIEIGGLVLVIVVAGKSLVVAEVFNYEQFIPRESGDWRGIGAGAFLAFYAFLGFEDMVNVAEEVRDPSRNLPRAIIIALVVSTLLYLLVGIAAVSSVSVETLSASAAPMVTIARVHDLSIHVMAAIALVAITNGALIQIIKSSRILYGMAGLGDAPSAFGRVSARTNTPLLATVVVSVLTLFLAISLATIELASLTSLVTLGIFVVVNASLWKLKRTERGPSNIVSYPITIPIVGLVLCIMLIAAHLI
jgi:amino acid transporter